MVYDALDISLQSVRVQISPFGVPSGITERGTNVNIKTAAVVLEFMAGAAAILGICRLDFEEMLHTFTSDFCVLLRNVPQLQVPNSQKPMVWLAFCRLGAEHFVRDWVVRYRRSILRFASALMKARVSNNIYEISGDALHNAMSLAWRGNKPSATETESFAQAGLERLPQEIEINLEWQQTVLRFCEEQGA